MYAKNPNWDDSDAVDVRDWLGDAVLAGYAPLPAAGDWPAAVLDDEPFPLEAAALGFAYVVAPAPASTPSRTRSARWTSSCVPDGSRPK